MGKKNKKRTKSESSPDSVSLLPDKRISIASSYKQAMAQTPAQSQISNQAQGFVPPPPIYPGGSTGQYYQSPQQMYMNSPQFSQTPISPGMGSVDIQLLFEKLENKIDSKFEIFDTKLQKLDNIEKQISNLTQKMTSIDTKVTFLETKVNSCQSQITEIEASRAYDSSSCDEIRAKQLSIDKQLDQNKKSHQAIRKDYESLICDHNRVSEDLIDIQTRSMRDNLLFYEFVECETATERKEENCEAKILKFCKETLNMNDADESIKIDRAHRIGQYKVNKRRPIVVKFNYFKDKINIKQRVFDNSDLSNRSVSDQYPVIVQQRRRLLYPSLKKAREAGIRASLHVDKLYVNNKMYTVDALPIPEIENLTSLPGTGTNSNPTRMETAAPGNIH